MAAGGQNFLQTFRGTAPTTVSGNRRVQDRDVPSAAGYNCVLVFEGDSSNSCRAVGGDGLEKIGWFEVRVKTTTNNNNHNRNEIFFLL